MSASLVGSEMCIRDRPGGAPPKEPGPLQGHARSAALAAGQVQTATGGACLLYTSDAADDM
eukprot:12128695-Alexandrium_andersonii.AAC.1